MANGEAANPAGFRARRRPVRYNARNGSLDEEEVRAVDVGGVDAEQRDLRRAHVNLDITAHLGNRHIGKREAATDLNEVEPVFKVGDGVVAVVSSKSKDIGTEAAT